MQAKKITSGSNVLKLPKEIRKSIMVLEAEIPARLEDIIPHKQRVSQLKTLNDDGLCRGSTHRRSHKADSSEWIMPQPGASSSLT